MVDFFNCLDTYTPSGWDVPVIPADHGFIAWPFAPTAVDGNAALPTAGRLNLVRLRRVPPRRITNLVLHLSGGGSSLTAGQCFAALFTAAGVHLRSTADQAAAWASSGVKTMALSSTYDHVGGDLYFGCWFNGSTGPSVYRAISGDVTNVGLSAPNFVSALADTGLTTAAPATVGTQTATNSYWWCALS